MIENQILNNEVLETNKETCWQAVQARDSSYDGVFVYAVASTRIYCRPSCPSRRPNRAQVHFYNAPEDAARAGFRPCKRCRPDELTYPQRQIEQVEQACRHIEQNPDTSLSLSSISQQVNSSPHHFHRTFKQVTGITPHQYTDAARVAQLKTRLQDEATVTNALYDAGYGSSRGLYEKASAQLGMTPASYKRGGQGAVINFSIVPCSLGLLLLAATTKGVCALTLGDSEDELEAALRKEFYAAQVQRDDKGLEAWTQTLIHYLEGQQPYPDLPLDIQATAFQARVWQVLRSIPYGETRTYTQVAEAIGQPQAARAAARACATNTIGVLIPCHRVLRGDGSLSGYRWGIERKRKLLQHEAQHAEREE